MPCFSIQTSTIAFSVKNLQLLKQALETQLPTWTVRELGGRLIVTARLSNGEIGTTFTVDPQRTSIDIKVGREHLIDEMKRAFSHHVVQVAAQAYGWLLQRNRLQQNTYLAER